MLIEMKSVIIIFYCVVYVGGAGRFNDRGGRFNDRRNGAGNSAGGNGNMDRANRNVNNNNMRGEYVDPWAHNGSNSQMIPNAFGGNNNGNMSSLGMTSLMSSPTNQNGNMFSGGGGGSNNNMEMDGKTTTQVTIPKDVRNFFIHMFVEHI